MAQYDLPAMLKFVTTKTSQSSLYYIGHSQGTTIGFAEFSTNKELAKMVKTFFALAPVGTIGHTKTPFLTIPSETSMEIKVSSMIVYLTILHSKMYPHFLFLNFKQIRHRSSR